MWLLNTETLALENFEGETPPYAILSHRWEEEEVSFKDVQNKRGHDKKGYEKIKSCCHKALKHGFNFAWVDTCCIDERSSAEISEAINSMYKWYQNAKVCYAFLPTWEWVSKSTSISQRVSGSPEAGSFKSCLLLAK